MLPSGEVRKNRSVRQNSIALFFSRLAAQGVAVLFVAILARRFGLDSFGRFTFYAAVVLVGNTFTNFGTDTYLIREIARAGKMSSLLPAAFGLQILLTSLWWLATLSLRAEPGLLVYSLSLFPLAVISLATTSLRAFERMDLVWLISLANGIVQLCAAFFSYDLWTLCSFLFLGQLFIAFVSYWICAASLVDFRLLPFDDIRPLLHVTLPFATLTILLVLSQRLGVLIVSFLLGDASTGLFSSVARLVDGLKLGHYAVLGALLPVISRRAQEANHSFRSGFGLLLGLSSLMAIGLSLFPRLILFIVYGERFVPAATMLAILGWTLIPYTISSFIAYDLIARERERVLVKATMVSLAITVVFYFSLIPRFGLDGAIYAALAGEIAQAAICILVASRSGDPIHAHSARQTMK